MSKKVTLEGAMRANTLILSDAPFCHSFGFGVTLRTFFRSWRNDQLVTIYPAALNRRVEIDREVCQRHIPIDFPASGARRHCIPFLLGQLPAWRERFSGKWLDRQLGKWRPDTVFTMTLTGMNLIYGDWIASHYGARHVILITDDFLTEQLPEESIRMTFHRAAKVLVISEEMQEQYEKRYELSSDVVHNGADERVFGKPYSAVRNEAFTARYIGGLDRNFHFGAIEDIAEAVSLLNGSGTPARFEIFGSAYNRTLGAELHNGRDVFYGGVIPKEEGFALMHTADLLVVPVSFNSPAIDRYRLSFPTKLPECLATGRPALVYGPSDSAAVRFCVRHDVGLVQSERSVDRLVCTMNDLVRHPQRYRDRAVVDQSFILRHYSSEAVGRRFRSLLLDSRPPGASGLTPLEGAASLLAKC